MFTFTNVTTRDRYIEAKKNQGVSFEYVPNTATGYEDCRKYINANGFSFCKHRKELLFVNGGCLRKAVYLLSG